MNQINICNGHTLFIDGNYITPRHSQRIYNHSPDGFSFGYCGSGPAQAALGILLEFTGVDTALQLYQKFKAEYVAAWKDPDMVIELDIKEWIKQNRYQIKEFNVLQRNGIAYVIPPDRVTKMLLKYGCPENELWLIEDSDIESAERFYGVGTIIDLTHGNDYMRCIYHHENGAITDFAGYNNNKEFRKACIWLSNQLKPEGKNE